MGSKIQISISIIVSLLAIGWITLPPVHAETRKTLAPYFLVESEDTSVDSFPLKKTDVRVNISGVMADVKVRQTYTNDGSNPIHARYIFPASTRAAVHGMQMTIGEEVIVARVKERQAAQQEYQQAKDNGQSASLLEQQRPNVFSMKVANILPNDTIEVELRYTELLVPTDGTYDFTFPTVVGPRYSSQSEEQAPATDQWVKNPYLQKESPPRSRFDMTVQISTAIPLNEVECTSHRTLVNWQNQSVAEVKLDPTEPYGGNRDFVLKYRLVGKKIESGLLLYEGERENFFLLMVQPPERVQPEQIPPREYIFVVDVSGSMHGFPLNTAKILLKNLVSGLRPQDRFNVLLFAGNSRVLAPSSLPASPTNIQEALILIDRQRGGGGTELYAALKRGLALPRSEGTSRSMVVVTDGYITAEKDVFDLIQTNLNRTNVFAFGIGSSVNRYLIEGMAKAGMGEPFVVLGPDQARPTSEQFRRYIAAPVLTDISIHYDGFKTSAVEPVSIPDLFANRPVVVFGKWEGRPQGRIELTAAGGAGPYRRAIDVATIPVSEVNSALPYLWARTRISRLSDFNTRRGESDHREEVTALGLTYNLLTVHTSFVAVHEVVRNAGGDGQQVKQPLPLPHKVSELAVGGGMSSVPEPEFYLMAAIIGVLLLWSATRKRRLRCK